MAQPSLGLDMQSEVRLSPEERAASWTDFRGLVTAPTSNRGPQMNPKPTRPPIPLHCSQDMSESGDVWATLTTLAATTGARQQDGQVAAVAEAEAVAEAVAEVEAVVEVKAKAEAKAEAEAEVEAEAVGEVEAEAEAEVKVGAEVESEAEAETSDGTTCTGTQVNRTEERAAGWTDFRGLVTNPLPNPDSADLIDPALYWLWQDMSEAGDAWAALTTLAGGK